MRHNLRIGKIIELAKQFDADQQKLAEEIAEIWEQENSRQFEEGYDKAATEITLKLQSCIPSSARTVPDARVQGAWRDAANIALNHIGRLRRGKL